VTARPAWTFAITFVACSPSRWTGWLAALVPPGDIHRVTNDGDRPSISLHVYGADLRQRGTSIRRRYDLPILARRAA
jgi:hypothetical protein